jgi:hypothetical protein
MCWSLGSGLFSAQNPSQSLMQGYFTVEKPEEYLMDETYNDEQTS